ncbi:MAG: hypothetical protein HQM07_05945 [Zetaproteobacteria bacterium]|nr:hypothetical protein [Zetaproteobacteria bacterium]
MWFKSFLLTMFVFLSLSACGLKQDPQPLVADAEPVITQLSHEINGNTLRLSLLLGGGSMGVGYQIDQTEIDPYCDCPSFWRRMVEEYPNPKNIGQPLNHLIALKKKGQAYAYRVRAIDAIGRFSPWSQVIRATSQLED